MPEIGSAGLLVATDSALLAGYKNLASLERTTSLNMEHMQAYAMAAITKAQQQQQVRGEACRQQACTMAESQRCKQTRAVFSYAGPHPLPVA